MPRYCVGDLKASRIPTALGYCANDPRFLLHLNEFEERALAHGRWWGSIKEVQLCVYDGKITFGREIATLEQLAICGTPVPIFNLWYQFTRNLARVQQCSSCGCCENDGTSSDCSPSMPTSSCAFGHFQMRMDNDVVSFSTTVGSNKVLRLYPTSATDVGKKVTILGNDANGNWVRTNPGGIWQDGETVTLALPFVNTATVWAPGTPAAALAPGRSAGILKDVTNQPVTLFEYDTVAMVERQLGSYQPTETRPLYRSAFIPNFSQIKCSPCTCQDAAGNNLRTLNAIAKLQHIDYVNDNDFVMFENIAAYKEGMTAVRDWENGDMAKGNWHFYGVQAAPTNARGGRRVINRSGAIPMLSAELRAMTGDRTELYVQFEATNSFPATMAGFI